MTDTNWLPEGYKEPVTSNYMQFELGDNTFRILDKPIMGIEYWVTVDGKRKPKRIRPEEKVPVEELELNPTTGKPEVPKFFWAFPVYNYLIDKIQILEVTQKTIRQALQSYISNPKWGNPIGYTINVTKTKEGGKTSYSVSVDPKEELPKEIIERYKAMHINLEALYEGNDPFNSNPKDELAQDIKEIFDSKA